MEMSFCQKRLERLVSDETKLNKKFGHFAKYVRLRLDLLRTAKTLADVPAAPPPRCHQPSGGLDEVFAVDVKTKADKWRIEFRVANVPVPRKPDGGIDLRLMTAIEIIEISEHYT
ncbi:MAG: system killer suppression protein [Rhodomicrobium sp.]